MSAKMASLGSGEKGTSLRCTDASYKYSLSPYFRNLHQARHCRIVRFCDISHLRVFNDVSSAGILPCPSCRPQHFPSGFHLVALDGSGFVKE